MSKDIETKRAASGVLLWAALLAGCGGESGPGPVAADPALDLDALFAPASASEIAAVRAEWFARDVEPTDVQVEASGPFALGGTAATLSVVSHAIEGGRHYGAVITPDGAGPGSLPVMVYAHGGDQGVSASTFGQIAFALGDVAADFVWVVPSFRSEPLSAAGEIWQSEGQASPWDRDVDDALALLGAALELTAAADGGRVGVLGLSRGAGVALLMGIRDARINRVVEFFGPTDFLGPFVREVVEEALDGALRDLPGMATLNERFIQPLRAGSLTIAEVRAELVRRSAVLFAADLPPLQIHHGTADDVVDDSQAEALIEVLESLGRGSPDDGFFIYLGGRHDPLTLDGSVPRTVDFLEQMTASASPDLRGPAFRSP